MQNPTPLDRAIHQEHPISGFVIIKELEQKGLFFPKEVYNLIRDHHELYDGSGFPNGKKGRLSARYPNGLHPFAAIVSLADYFSFFFLDEEKRPKKGRFTFDQSINEIKKQSKYFDPFVLKAFNELIHIQS